MSTYSCIIPISTTIETKSDHLALSENQTLTYLIEEIDQYRSKSLSGKIFGDLAHQLVSTPEELVPMGEKLVSIGLCLIHASLYSGDNRFPFKKIGRVYLLDFIHDPSVVDKLFIEELDLSLSQSDDVINRRGKKTINTVSEIYSEWAIKKYGLPLNEELRQIVFDSLPVVAVWDHHLEPRTLFGDTWKIPRGTHAPAYDFWKMNSFPTTYFLSDKMANGSRQYVTSLAESLKIDWQRALSLAVAHEKMHRVVTIPISDLCIADGDSWWSEAVAITYTDITNYQRHSDSVKQQITVEGVLHPQNGVVNYLGSLSLWLALSAIESGSDEPRKIFDGSDSLIGRMVELARISGIRLLSSQIPAELFPRIPEAKLFAELNKKLAVILKMLEEGSLVYNS